MDCRESKRRESSWSSTRWKMSSRKELRHDVVKLASGAHAAAGPLEGGKPTPLALTAGSLWLCRAEPES